MIFRWSFWGDHKAKNSELLYYSIASFRKQFGKGHQYIVYTDGIHAISGQIKSLADIRQFPNDETTLFNIQSKATWLKWCPKSRLDLNQTELYIDSDVFLLKYPDELDDFLSNPLIKFAIMDEFLGQSWQHGAMRRKVLPDTPFVNAGFFIQKARSDITPNLLKEFNWWKNNIKTEEQTHHDEQGALAIALTKYLLNHELYIFPKNKYMIIGENENTNKKNLNDITLFHAVYPNHPAFYRFHDTLDKIIYA